LGCIIFQHAKTQTEEAKVGNHDEYNRSNDSDLQEFMDEVAHNQTDYEWKNHNNYCRQTTYASRSNKPNYIIYRAQNPQLHSNRAAAIFKDAVGKFRF
jgi:hypothetical protein